MAASSRASSRSTACQSRRRELVAALRREARLARVRQQELVPRFVDHGDVAHQQVPVGTLHGGDQAVAEETGETIRLLAPGLEVDAGLARPGVAQTAVVRRAGPGEPLPGESGGEIGRV